MAVVNESLLKRIPPAVKRQGRPAGLHEVRTMIRLFFEEEKAHSNPVLLGPAPWFRVGGNFIRQGPHGTIAGTYRQHGWEVQARHFTRFDCRESSLIHFEDAAGGCSEEFGPFREFYAADGVVHAEGDLFAKFIEETQLWHCYVTENFWPYMFIHAPRGGNVA